MRHSGRYCGLVAASFLVAGLGCGGNRLVQVEGVVTLDGQPMEGAMVSFLPDEHGGRFAQGTTAKNGFFRLTTYKPDDGALPGDYRVTVTLIPTSPEEEKALQQIQASEQAGDGKQIMAAMGKMAAARRKALERSPVPAVYREGGQTPLRQRVPPEGKVVLALTRNPPPVKPTQSAESERKKN